MKKYIQKIKDSINKSWNNKTSKTKRLIIYGLLLAYMGFALYVIFMPAPDYRYEEYVRSEPPATNLIIEEEAAPADSLSDEKIREMEEFFNQFNSESYESRCKRSEKKGANQENSCVWRNVYAMPCVILLHLQAIEGAGAGRTAEDRL